MENVNLCQCNMCDNIFIDQNSQIGAKEYLVDISKITNLQYLKDDNDEYYWGCPICETDSFLQDEINEEKLLEIQK